MKKILTSLFSIAVISLVVAGATGAFFTDSETVAGQITTGNLSIDLKNQDSSATFTFGITNMTPGDDEPVLLDILNSGNIPVHLRGAAFGAWQGGELDNTKIYITRVERDTDPDVGEEIWEVLAGDGINPITDIFYYSPTGAEINLFQVGGNERAHLRLTVKFAEDAGDEYQNKVYDASIKVEAKQANNASEWPAP